MVEEIVQIVVWGLYIFFFLFAIIVHEVAHGVAALTMGDRTPLLAGRITLNPIPHIDPVGSIAVPLLLFITQKLAGIPYPVVLGWAKPVPVSMEVVVQRGGLVGAIWVSAAGILANLLLAFIAVGGMVLLPPNSLFAPLLLGFALINIVLALFNLIPIPPIDGGRILEYFLLLIRADRLAFQLEKLERFGFMIIFLLWFLPPVRELFGEAVDFFLDQFITIWSNLLG
jgi:Zn-dependent protease